MGGCLTHKQLKTALNTPTQFKQDKQLQPNIYHPITTTLFNLLRKSTQLQILHAANKQQNKIFYNQNYPKIDALENKDIKLLYSFKNILVIQRKQCEEVLGRIVANSNPKIIYEVGYNQARSFAQSYPIFSEQKQAKQLPIFAIYSEQILKSGPKKQIFLHSINSTNNAFYDKLGIAHTIKYTSQKTGQQIEQQLKRCHKQKILLLHSSQIKQDSLLNVLANYLVAQYKVSAINAQIYLRRCLPQTSLNQQITTNGYIASPHKQQPTSKTIASRQSQPLIFPITSQKSLKQLPKQSLSITQVYQKYIQQLYIQYGQNQPSLSKLDRSINLLTTLISNIYNNKGSDNYRTVRKTNKQINELLGKYKNGVKLLNQIGFVDEGGSFVNRVDVKYLKIYRMDLEMAYRNFIDSLKK